MTHVLYYVITNMQNDKPNDVVFKMTYCSKVNTLAKNKTWLLVPECL